MRKKAELVGQIFGKYLVVASEGINKHGQQMFKCRMLDGQHKTVKLSNLYRERIRDRKRNPISESAKD